MPFLIETAEDRQEMGEREGSKGPGLESNPGWCSKDSALVHGARALPGELQG